MGDRLSDMLAAEFGVRYEDKRDALAADYRPWDSAGFGAIVLHHTGGDKADTPEEIDDLHRRGRGWPGIGYHLMLGQGRVWYVGDVDTRRAHVGGRNHEALGVVLAGNYEHESVDARDLINARRLVAVLDRYYGHRKALETHRSFALPGRGTVCPGKNLRPLVPTLREGGVAPARPGGPALSRVEMALAERGRVAREIHTNREAALMRAVLRDGGWAVSDEWDIQLGGVTYIGQTADGPWGTRAYYVRRGEWDAVTFVDIS